MKHGFRLNAGARTSASVLGALKMAQMAAMSEEEFAKAGFAVFSNAKNHRYDDDVPILIPHANASHLDIIPHQQKMRGYTTGFIVTNANCSSTGLVVPLKPILDNFGIEKMFVVTMQAISGAGYPGASSLLTLFVQPVSLSLSLFLSLSLLTHTHTHYHPPLHALNQPKQPVS